MSLTSRSQIGGAVASILHILYVALSGRFQFPPYMCGLGGGGGAGPANAAISRESFFFCPRGGVLIGLPAASPGAGRRRCCCLREAMQTRTGRD